MDGKLLEKLQDAVALVYEENVMKLLKKDGRYQKLEEKEKEYELKYQKIQEALSDEDTEVIDKLLSLRDQEAMLYSFWMFAAGVKTGASFSALVNAY